jgi:hypothetical protein
LSSLTDTALVTFERLIENAVDLIEISAERRSGRGRRREEMSLNRGAVILAVAAWQTFVEETTRGIVDTLAVGATSPLHKLIKADAFSAIGRFNTPNSVNSLDLFARVGFDPAPTWGVTFRWVWARLGSGGPITKSLSPTPAQARFELDAWLQVRHRIAHGRVFEATDRHLEFVLSGTSRAGLTLWRSDSERCIAFMRAIAEATSAEAALQFP